MKKKELTEVELASSRWYYALPDERKAKIMADGFQFVFDTIKHTALSDNPFMTKEDVKLEFMKVTQMKDVSEETYQFVVSKMKERSEAEWQTRFKAMKKNLGWSYDDMARFIGAASGDSIKASVNRQLPAFAKLAVCVFEQLTKNVESGSTAP